MAADQAALGEGVDACTVIARNRIGHARVLADSFRAHHPSGRLTVLVVDDLDGSSDGDVPFDLIRPADVFGDLREFHRMAAMYSVLELTTALKPAILRHMLANGATEAVCLDADLWITASLEDAVPLARAHSIVLTPHYGEPAPPEAEAQLLLNGVFNTGFVAVGSGADRFLSWWSERLGRYCLFDRHNGFFNEQAWVDFVPSLFDHHVLRDTAWNVGPWNASLRPVEWDGSSYLVDGRPLRFFHFSGFDPERPHLLTRWEGQVLPVLLSERPALERLCQAYAGKLLAAGALECMARDYGYDRLHDGTSLARADRRLYREALLAAEKGGTPEPPNPFEEGPRAFLDWLREERGEPPLARTTSHRPSTEELEWPAALVPGVNLVAHRWHDATPNTIEALRGSLGRLGVSSSTLEVTRFEGRLANPFRGVSTTAVVHDTTILDLSPVDVPAFAFLTPEHFFADRYSIGLWQSPGTDENALRQSFALLDEVWVESVDGARELVSVADIPVFSVPLPLDLEHASRSASDAGLDAGFLFVTVVDLSRELQFERTLALIDAFLRAFAPESGRTLLVREVQAATRSIQLERVRLATRRSDVRIVSGPMNHSERTALIAASGSYVTIQDSAEPEQEVAEAMALSRPVVAFPGSGRAVLDDRSAFMVPGPEAELVGQLAGLLRHVADSPQEAGEKTRVAREHILRHRSPAAFDEFLDRRLRAISATRSGQRADVSRHRRTLRDILDRRALRGRRA